jgi:hypothetical protein
MTSLVGSIATHKALAVGLWIAALGILLEAATGAKGSPKVPPGIIILAVVGLLVYLTSGFMWTVVLGLFLAGLVLIGVFATPGTAYRLYHPHDVGPLIGTLLQLIGLLFALVAGFARMAVWFSGSNGTRSGPQG